MSTYNITIEKSYALQRKKKEKKINRKKLSEIDTKLTRRKIVAKAWFVGDLILFGMWILYT